MAWQTKVAAWVIPLVAEYAIPDDATVITDVELGKLGSATAGITLEGDTHTVEFPGLIPNYSVEPIIEAKTGGFQYTVKALKAVGFYGIYTEVLVYESKRFNSWVFPIDRKQFGYCAIARGNIVLSYESIGYSQQIHTSDSVLSLVSNYDDQFDTNNVFNSADKFVCTHAHLFLFPTVRMRVSFLPVYEVWGLRFFKAESNICLTPTSLAPPSPPYPESNPAPPWMAGTTLLCQDNAFYTLRCTPIEGYSWVFNGFNN